MILSLDLQNFVKSILIIHIEMTMLIEIFSHKNKT